jgi:hypothetical protein
MSKRPHDDDTVSPRLPLDVLLLIGAVLRDPDDRSSACALASLALCSHTLYSALESDVKCQAPANWWCILCRAARGVVALGCQFGSHCAVYVTLLDRHSPSGKERLCERCCQQRCDLCQRGNCGCDDDMTYCRECERTICSQCRHDDDMCGYDDEGERLLCARCCEQGCSSSHEGDEEDDDESQSLSRRSQ